jgi:hypothetical protein
LRADRARAASSGAPRERRRFLVFSLTSSASPPVGLGGGARAGTGARPVTPTGPIRSIILIESSNERRIDRASTPGVGGCGGASSCSSSSSSPPVCAISGRARAALAAMVFLQ